MRRASYVPMLDFKADDSVNSLCSQRSRETGIPSQEHRNARDDFSSLGPTLKRYEPHEERLIRSFLEQTPSLSPLVDRLVLAAQQDAPILIEGETGTGKTYLARLIHELSPRKKDSMLTVPCGALAANLLASELFGHCKGAFTGAERTRIGKFTAVGQGTLLLDEIDILSPGQQAMLLRVVETGEFEPVGTNETQKCEARFIAASKANLENAVQQKRFRADLYYRLSVLCFHLPPLRQRLQDIGPLTRRMLPRFNQRFGRNVSAIHSEALTRLESYAWPGNLRELENAVQRAVLVCNEPVLLPRHLPQFLHGASGGERTQTCQDDPDARHTPRGSA